MMNQSVLSRREIDLGITTQMMRSQMIPDYFSRFFIFSFVKKLMHPGVEPFLGIEMDADVEFRFVF